MRLSAKEIGRRYDEAAKAYGFWRPLKEFAGIGRMRRRLLSRVRGEVLEVAVGTGESLRHYPLNYASDITLTAVDISPGMLELAQREARRLGIEVDTRVMDAERLEHPANRFDTVVSTFSVCTFPDPVAALGEMRRVCHPDGRILLLGHGLSDRRPIAALQHLRARLQRQKQGCQGNRDTIALAAAAGLETAHVRRSCLGIFYEIENRPQWEIRACT